MLSNRIKHRIGHVRWTCAVFVCPATLFLWKNCSLKPRALMVLLLLPDALYSEHRIQIGSLWDPISLNHCVWSGSGHAVQENWESCEVLTIDSRRQNVSCFWRITCKLQVGKNEVNRREVETSRAHCWRDSKRVWITTFKPLGLGWKVYPQNFHWSESIISSFCLR